MLMSFGIYERNALLRFRFVSLQSLKACFWWSMAFLSISLILRFLATYRGSLSSRREILTTASLLGLEMAAAPLPGALVCRGEPAAANPFRRLEQGSRAPRPEFEQDPVSAYQVVGCIGSKGARLPRAPQRAFWDSTRISWK